MDYIQDLAEKLKLQLNAAQNETIEYKKLLEEREMDSAKLHTLEIKYNNEIDYYQK